MLRFPHFSRLPRHLLLPALLCALAPSLYAQIEVKLNIPRHLFVCYEPIVATVSISNMTGHDITLSDQPPERWFAFEIYNTDNTTVPPRATDYHLDPLSIPNGETVKRKVNLVNLYPVTDYGMYHARAVVYFAPLDKYFGSKPQSFEVSEGQTLWQQTVGIPDGEKDAGQYRTFELLSFHQPDGDVLYVRIQDKDAGVVYATVPLGHLVMGYPPEEFVDTSCHLHVLQMVSPKEYLYTGLGPNAELLGQQDYADVKTRPHLRRSPEGTVGIAGGVAVVPQTPQEAAAASGPKLSDRPPGMPAD